MKQIPETHQQGMLTVENDEAVRSLDQMDCDFGLQVHTDGRVWICINGVAWIRFKPFRKSMAR